MSMIEDVYRAHYKEVRSRLIGKISKSVVIDTPKEEEAARKEYRNQIEEALMRAAIKEKEREATRKRIMDAATIALATEGPISGASIMLAICQKHNISKREFISKSRTDRVVKCRDEVIGNLKVRLGWSQPKIGRLIGRDHTTVLHSLRKPETIRIMEELVTSPQTLQDDQHGNVPE